MYIHMDTTKQNLKMNLNQYSETKLKGFFVNEKSKNKTNKYGRKEKKNVNGQHRKKEREGILCAMVFGTCGFDTKS